MKFLFFACVFTNIRVKLGEISSFHNMQSCYQYFDQLVYPTTLHSVELWDERTLEDHQSLIFFMTLKRRGLLICTENCICSNISMH